MRGFRMVTIGLKMVSSLLRMTRKVAKRVMMDFNIITVVITLLILLVSIIIRIMLMMVWILINVVIIDFLILMRDFKMVSKVRMVVRIDRIVVWNKSIGNNIL